MLKLATILDNPGEPHAQTRYRAPKHLRDLGYNGLVIYETTGLSGIDHLDRIGTGEIRRWVGQQLDEVRQRIEQSCDAGLDTYISYDVMSLARGVVDQHIDQFVCRNRREMLCPASDDALERCAAALKGLLGMLPPVAGVVLRFGDNDAARLPYLVGNDIYLPHCSRCSQLGRADRIVRVLKRFHQLVVGELDLRLIARAWNVRPNGMHDSVELCERIAARLPGEPDDDRFVLSFKCTETDFWRYQKWNRASLMFGGRPILYELQCQREFEGKGGLPNWQVPLWRDGMPEVRSDDEPGGLADVAERIAFAGLWAWVRGGGWGGPFIKNETWIDANVFAVPRLADDPKVHPRALADEWVRTRLKLEGDVAAVLRDILEHSPDLIRDALYIGPYAKSRDVPWHPNADWIQDDLVDAESAWRIIKKLPDASLDAVVAEKQSVAERVSADRAALQQRLTDDNRPTIEPLVNTLTYGESLIESLAGLLGGLVAYRRWQKSKADADAEQCRQRLRACQNHWNQHTQRHGSLSGAATAFRESHLWDLTERLLEQLK
jgi:hypothetical protein